MAITLESLQAKYDKLKGLIESADKDYRKRDLTKQLKRVSRRLAPLKKKAAEIAAAKAKAAKEKAEAEAAAAEAAAAAEEAKAEE